MVESTHRDMNTCQMSLLPDVLSVTTLSETFKIQKPPNLNGICWFSALCKKCQFGVVRPCSMLILHPLKMFALTMKYIKACFKKSFQILTSEIHLLAQKFRRV